MISDSWERNNDKRRVLDNTISQIEKVFSRGVIMKLKQNLVEEIDQCYIGSISLDLALWY